MRIFGVGVVFLVACSGTQSVQNAPDPVAGGSMGGAPANVAPVSSQTTSEAVNDGPACGSRGLAPCPASQFCSFPATAHCGETDHPGRCTVKPEMCTKMYAPVCGCDGKTYGNACEASSQGQSVASTGACVVK